MSRAEFIAIRVGALVVVICVGLLGGTQTAEAHNVLVSSTPAKGASLTAAPSTVELVFNEPVESGFKEITVTGPDKTSRWEGGAAEVHGASVSIAR